MVRFTGSPNGQPTANDGKTIGDIGWMYARRIAADKQNLAKKCSFVPLAAIADGVKQVGASAHSPCFMGVTVILGEQMQQAVGQ